MGRINKCGYQRDCTFSNKKKNKKSNKKRKKAAWKKKKDKAMTVDTQVNLEYGKGVNIMNMVKTVLLGKIKRLGGKFK